MYREYPVAHIFGELQRDNLLPAILFRTARKQCDQDIQKLARTKVGVLSTNQQLSLRQAVHKIIEKYDFDKEIIFEHPQYAGLIKTGVGAHHAGQLLMWRILLEELMTAGMLRLMIATSTVAAGVDFPARTVVVTAHSRRGGEGFRLLTSSELQQMSGRAGRRGKDSVGFCLVAPSIFCDARVIADISKKPPEPLTSAYFASPSTVLNLLRYRSVDDLKYTVSKSLASFLDRKEANTLRSEIASFEAEIESGSISEKEQKKLEKRIRRENRTADALENTQLDLLEKSLTGLERLKHLENGKLTEKGHWAANLCTTLVLEIAEAIDSGLLSDTGLVELVGLMASISGTPHKMYLSIKVNPLEKSYYERMTEVVSRVSEAYERPPGISEVQVMPDAATTVLTWMEAENWQEFSSLLRLAGVAEGDVARLVSQTADHLHQLTRLSEKFPTLAAYADEARARILRPPLSEVLATSAA